jgi:SAM-dependent methyltransferase
MVAETATSTEMNSHDEVVALLRRIVDDGETESWQKTFWAFRLLAKHRSRLIGNTLRKGAGPGVRTGPFAGLKLPRDVAEGCLAPKLLGSYEKELHALLRAFGERGYEAVVDVGCAEGYYAAGLARLLPQVHVFAYDLNERARTLCAETARLNGLSERITIAERCSQGEFARFADRRTLVVCDIEGDEDSLLDPDAAGALRHMDILVELHECFDAGIPERVTGRFAPSHDVSLVRQGARDVAEHDEIAAWPHIDQLLAVWEWRSGPTPWAFMRAHELGPPR